MNPIGNINIQVPTALTPTTTPGQTPGAGNAPVEGPGSFKNFLLESIHEVNSMQQQADVAVENLVTGGEVNPAEVLTAVQKADVAFRLMIQVRNKMVEAYEQVQNIRV